MAQQFRLKWGNHMSNVLDVVKNLFSSESLVDVTLACDGMSIKAHKVILSACSPFFQSLLLENPCQHPIIIIPHMKYSELKPLVEFMYEGEISVTRDQLTILAKYAQELKIKGLAEISFEKTFSNESPVATDGFNTPTEISSNKFPGYHMHEQSSSVLDCNDNFKEDDAKPQSSDVEELSNNILVPTNDHYEALQMNDSSHNSMLPESAELDNFQLENSKSLEQITTPNDFLNDGNDMTVLQSKEMNSESNIEADSFSDASEMSVPFEAMSSNDQPETPTDIKPELIESDRSTSPVPGTSHDTEDSMMMDNSIMSPHMEFYEEGNTYLEPVESQPEGNSSVIRTIYFSKNDTDSRKVKNDEVSLPTKKFKYKCKKCDLLVASKGHLAIHMRTHTGERPFSCHVCGKTAIRQHDLQLHMRTHTGIKPYACPICGMKFNNSSNYRRHYKRRHPTSERVVQVCKVCDEQFDSKELLNGHLINQHAIENSHVCVICQKSYKRHYDLKTHLRVHSKEKPYACKICFKLFSYKSNQIRHVRQHFIKSKSCPTLERKKRSKDPDYMPKSDA